jgi:adenosylcobinamide kinase/adenosylcobinamide-phosphate guanylyltransferase
MASGAATVSDSKLVLIGGGARSGKSAYAVQRALSLGPRRIFVATAEAFDDEMRTRIAAHVAERANHFTTLEAPRELEQVLESIQVRAEAVDVVVIDCLTLWLSNLLLADVPAQEIELRVARLASQCQVAAFPVLLVTNEVGFGVVPDTALGRQFRDITGRAHQLLARSAGEVLLAALGCMLRIKPAPVVLAGAPGA